MIYLIQNFWNRAKVQHSETSACLQRLSRHNKKDVLFVFLGSAFGLGLLPIAPGSFGAITGVIIHVAIGLMAPAHLQILFISFAFVLVCGLHFCLTKWAQQFWACSDPKNFVLDEVAGYLLVPILFQGQSLWKTALLGFLLFRILDVIKIPPARQIDRDMHGAWGVILDDLVSAVYSAGVMYMLLHVTNIFK